MKLNYKFLSIALLSIVTFKAHSQTPSFYQPVMYGESTGNEYVKDIVGDATGNAYVLGCFTSGPTFTIASGFTLTNQGSSDLFLAKYNPQGGVVWAKSAGGTNADTATAMAKDGNGNIIITGYFKSASITFGTITLTNADVSGTTNDIFIVKYDALGNVIWAVSYGGSGDDNANDIAIDSYNNINLVGKFNSTNLVLGTANLSNVGGWDVFYAQFDASGNPVWAHSASDVDTETANAVTVDGYDNIYITGSFNGSSLTFGLITLNRVFDYDAYIVKVSSSGTALWAYSAGDFGTDIGVDIVADATNSIYLTGNFNSGTMTIGSTMLTNSGSNDVFTVKYDTAGTAMWAKNTAGTGDELVNKINFDACGYIYLAGNYSTTFNFGANSLTNWGGKDAMILKYDDAGNEVWGKGCGVTNEDDGTALSGNTGGNIIFTGNTFNSSVSMDGTNIPNSDMSGSTSDFFLTKVQTTATDIYVNVKNSLAQPVTSGMVYLYSRLSTFAVIHPVDSIALSTGQVHFASVLNLNYFIKVVADTLNYPNMVNTYNGNFSLWDSIATWPHNCSTNDTINITMIEVAPSVGNGKISGRVTKSTYYGLCPTLVDALPRQAGDPIPGGDVKIGNNPGGNMIAATTTDVNGYYSFDHVNIGSYKIYVDIPGLGRDSSYSVDITPTDTLFSQRNYTADSDYVYIDISVGLNAYTYDEPGMSISPNPFSTQSILTLTENSNNQGNKEELNVVVFDVLGNKIRKLNAQTKKIVIEKGDLNPGIYFVRVQFPNRKTLNRKIVIQ